MRSIMVLLVIFLFGPAPFAKAEIWACKKGNGGEIYSDRSLGGNCRKLEKLPQLIPAPVTPAPSSREETGTEIVQPRPAEPEQTPVAGGGRKIDPPSYDLVTIHDVKATPNYNSALGTAVYQADMRLINEDADWTAAEVCVEVHFHDPPKIFIDVQQARCLEGLKSLEDRAFTVVYIGTIPAKVSAIEAEVHVSSVKWIK
jgi:hypothetical protein